MMHKPHDPPAAEQSQNEDHEAIGAVAEHFPRFIALGDAKDDGGAEGADECGAEM